MIRIPPSDFETLFTAPTHWIDVRAPIEFATGSVPQAVNLPLLEDSERQQIGITYKESGQDAAVALGHQLVSGLIRESRLKKWLNEIKQNPASTIYCYRGGLRSQIVQRWLHEQGTDCPIIAGGYKALRNFLLEILLKRTNSLEFHVVSGPTGSGKTKYLHSSGQPFLDLEALANHRGSAFGAMPTPQPSQADFENALAVQLIKLSKTKGPILIESESRMIGHRYLVDPIFNKIQTSKKIILTVSVEERVENILQDYVIDSCLRTPGNSERFDDFRKSVTLITRKLGGQRAQEILNDIDFSQKEFAEGQGFESNRVWIQKLLLLYYDPLYKGLY